MYLLCVKASVRRGTRTRQSQWWSCQSRSAIICFIVWRRTHRPCRRPCSMLPMTSMYVLLFLLAVLLAILKGQSCLLNAVLLVWYYCLLNSPVMHSQNFKRLCMGVESSQVHWRILCVFVNLSNCLHRFVEKVKIDTKKSWRIKSDTCILKY